MLREKNEEKLQRLGIGIVKETIKGQSFRTKRILITFDLVWTISTSNFQTISNL